MTKLVSIEGIGETYAAKLAAIEVTTIEQLLELGSKPSGRKMLAEKTEISSKLILKWLNRADLARIKGVSTQYADLLESAGVDTVPELAQRNAENLQTKMVEVNEAKALVRHLPPLSAVEDWISQAKLLPRAIDY
ncbi:DUF4332 domain-containing protein [Photobacterium phosphoreum]|jgi:predicted flap endonuclease-1-like 5' DNA nuclease|uniref:DUF4332 domain-containing protein n=1 Tax=Photobacterium phosphoreum TaxID=659 RepID=A0AAW4ZZ42_PHOPO|nr:DUF4332 domain-containing protein [Photobacterium phosphoreum]KJF86125.1 ferredoxin [Photobacterium phosphoreum]MCD9469044.1 DUF4332 domain-containing protein [Photobacterium phosphoreum]MCD9473953.1 DUF4332 domain-containing protein [Photobacterium phosphoreum]MCD9477547.1 DUF4332 domain-containing protein [Photobacterium phosphoreum]MCD9482131.1 DUF4332 domain-containing protein [Photobacterium phosphoreum]